MPLLPADDQVIAILCSDIHLCHRPPLFRSAEPDWYAAMARPLAELQAIQEQYNFSPGHGRVVPIVCAGDVFDRWNSPPELINFAIQHLPNMIAIPGQHDLPYHRYEDVKRSAYWTLVEAGKIINLVPGKPHHIPGACLHGFPWGHEPRPYRGGSVEPFGIQVAVVHKYVWDYDAKYPDAPTKAHISTLRNQFRGYSAVVIGDNHKGWLRQKRNIFNCGTFMRRKSDEAGYRPAVGLLHADGTIKRHYLDTSRDRTLAVSDGDGNDASSLAGMGEFISELQALGDSAIDFTEAVRQYLTSHEVSEGARQVILRSLERKQ